MHAAAWIISATCTKNKRAHLVPLSPLAARIVAELIEDADDDGFLFPGKGSGDHLTNASLSRAIARNIDYFGLTKFTPHDLRRTGSTQLAAFKVPRFDRDRVLNHTDRSVGAVYDIYEYQDEKRAVLNLWADVVERSAAANGSVEVRKLRKELNIKSILPGRCPGVGVLEPGLHVADAIADASFGNLLRLGELSSKTLSMQQCAAK